MALVAGYSIILCTMTHSHKSLMQLVCITLYSFWTTKFICRPFFIWAYTGTDQFRFQNVSDECKVQITKGIIKRTSVMVGITVTVRTVHLRLSVRSYHITINQIDYIRTRFKQVIYFLTSRFHMYFKPKARKWDGPLGIMKNKTLKNLISTDSIHDQTNYITFSQKKV